MEGLGNPDRTQRSAQSSIPSPPLPGAGTSVQSAHSVRSRRTPVLRRSRCRGWRGRPVLQAPGQPRRSQFAEPSFRGNGMGAEALRLNGGNIYFLFGFVRMRPLRSARTIGSHRMKELGKNERKCSRAWLLEFLSPAPCRGGAPSPPPPHTQSRNAHHCRGTARRPPHVRWSTITRPGYRGCDRGSGTGCLDNKGRTWGQRARCEVGAGEIILNASI